MSEVTLSDMDQNNFTKPLKDSEVQSVRIIPEMYCIWLKESNVTNHFTFGQLGTPMDTKLVVEIGSSWDFTFKNLPDVIARL